MTPLDAAELEAIGLIAIIRAASDEGLVEAAGALVVGGLRAVEVTLNTPGALEVIARLRRESDAALRIGAGTITRPDEAQAAMEAGAEFIVTPTLQLDTIALSRARGVPILCGCASPSEVGVAHAAGADFIKLFPAGTLGLEFIRALLGPWPGLKLMPTGGVTRDNLGDFLAAGCAGAAIGGNLVSGEILRARDWAGLQARARGFVKAFETARDLKRGAGSKAHDRHPG